MLRRGCTAISLSVSGHQSTANGLEDAIKALRLPSIYMLKLGILFPRLQQISTGGKCLAKPSHPIMLYSCRDCFVIFLTHSCVGPLLSNVKVCSSLSSAPANKGCMGALNAL